MTKLTDHEKHLAFQFKLGMPLEYRVKPYGRWRALKPWPHIEIETLLSENRDVIFRVRSAN